MTSSDHETAVQSAVSRLFGRDMVYMAAWAAQLVITALFTPVLTRLMLPSEYGRAMAATAVMQIQFVILGFGLYTGTQRAFAREGADAAGRVVTVACAMAVAGGAVFYVTGRLWSPLLGLGPFTATIKYAVIWAVLSALTITPLGLIRARDQLRWFVAVSFAQSVFAQVMAVLFVLIDSRSARGYMLGQVIGQLVAVVLVLAVARPRRVGREDRPMLARTVRFSLTLLPAALAGFVIGDSDRLIVHAELGATAVGRYALASNIGGFVAIALGSLAGIWVSRLFAIQNDRVLRDVVGASRDGISELAAGSAVAVAAASPILLAIWAPPRYDRAGLLLATALVAVQAVPSVAGNVYAQAMVVHNRTRAVAVVAVTAAGANVLLNLLLIPPFGIDGSALASLLDLICWAALYHWLLGGQRPPLRIGSALVVLLSVALTLASTALAPDGWALCLRVAMVAIAIAFCSVRLLSLVRPTPLSGRRNA
jgi:O-antigen/teichoic acid export membrane protein